MAGSSGSIYPDRDCDRGIADHLVCRRCTGCIFVSLAQGGAAVQVIVFLIVSLVLVLLIRPLAQKKFNSGHIRTNAQTLIGEEAVVIEPIDNLLSTGRVMIRGQEWTARSVDEKQKFKKDDVVSVVSISGVKLMVKCPE